MNTPPEFVVISTCSVATFVWSRLSETTLTGILVHPVHRHIEQPVRGVAYVALRPCGDPGAGGNSHRERPENRRLHEVRSGFRLKRHVGEDHVLLARRADSDVQKPTGRRSHVVPLVAYADKKLPYGTSRRGHELRPAILRVQRGPRINPRPPAIRHPRAVVQDYPERGLARASVTQ